MLRGFWAGIALTVALVVWDVAKAHEFIVKPAAMTVQAGAELQVSGYPPTFSSSVESSRPQRM